MTKYKEYYDKMVGENKVLFAEFRDIHAKYDLEGDKWVNDFNKIGEKVLAVAHDWENKLCKTSESAGYGSYTTKLAEKFQAEIKNDFPLIDHVGLIVKKFNLKKINLKS